MKKFDYISILNYQTNLKAIDLNKLGRINVLCGKNNSGKSTILNALNELSKGNVADELNASDTPLVIQTRRARIKREDFDLSIVTKTDKAFLQINNDPTKQRFFSKEFVFDRLLEYLKASLVDMPSLDKDQFKLEFLRALNRIGPYNSVFPEDIVNELVDQFLPSRKSVKLIPNNRHISSTVKVRDLQNCDIPGELIVNKIHFYKGQLPDSIEQLKFIELQKAFTEISEGLKFEIVLKGNLELEVLFTNKDGGWINADNSGLGLRDLLIILFDIIILDNDIILIEEPERHLHSSTQRRLLRYLSDQNKQFFIATHSNVFLDLDYVDSIFITEYINGQINVTNESSKARALMELGYSVADNIVSDLVILTEGPSDRAIIEHFLFELGVLKTKIVKFWPLGGDIMDKHDLSVLKDLYHVIALVDNDPGSSVIRTRFNAKCTELGIKCHRLQRYSIENYITLEALKRQFSTQIPSSLTSIDPNIKLEDQIGLNVKNTLNRVVKHMTFSDIKGTDLGDFILEVKRLLESS